MAKDHAENPKVDTRLDYVLKNRDRVAFVSRLTPVQYSPKFADALKLSGRFLQDTCWTWSLFSEPTEWNQAQAKWGASKAQNPKPKHAKTKPRTTARRRK